MPARRAPGRAPTGQPVLDSIVDDLRDADVALAENVIGRRQLHAGRYMVFEEDRILRGDGSESTRDIVVHPGAVAIVPVDAEGQILLVTQYRVACSGVMLEIPAGTLEVVDGVAEDPLAAAHRELEEETGYRAASMERICGFWTAPGFSTEYLTVYLATGLSAALENRLDPDADEDLRLSRISVPDAVAAIDAGVIEDAKSVAGILLVARGLDHKPG